jgi:hypothetical protein
MSVTASVLLAVNFTPARLTKPGVRATFMFYGWPLYVSSRIENAEIPRTLSYDAKTPAEHPNTWDSLYEQNPRMFFMALIVDAITALILILMAGMASEYWYRRIRRSGSKI